MGEHGASQLCKFTKENQNMELDEDLYKWFNSLSREERNEVTKCLIKMLYFQDGINKSKYRWIFAYYRIKNVLFEPWHISFDSTAGRIVGIFILANIPLLLMGFSGAHVSTMRLGVLVGSNIALAVAIDSVLRMIIFIWRYIKG